LVIGLRHAVDADHIAAIDNATRKLMQQPKRPKAFQSGRLWCFPLCLAGMSLIDTTDGVVMLGAYGWAFIKPIRKLYYNLTITLVSVLVVVIIGSIEVLALLAHKLSLSGPVWSFVDALNYNFETLGYFIIAIFVASRLASITVYQIRGYDTVVSGQD
jgi:nickel/cobalt transporter (NiCoT) family protein